MSNIYYNFSSRPASYRAKVYTHHVKVKLSLTCLIFSKKLWENPQIARVHPILRFVDKQRGLCVLCFNK